MTRVSRKLSWVSEMECVNFRVGWAWFKCKTIFSSSGRPWVQIMKISSMKRYHMKVCLWYVYTCLDSKSPITRLPILGADLVPMATLCVCRKCCPLNSKLLHSSTKFSKQSRLILEGTESEQQYLSRAVLIICMASWVWMLEYKEVTSKVTGRALSGSGGTWLILTRKSVISFM